MGSFGLWAYGVSGAFLVAIVGMDGAMCIAHLAGH